MHRLAAVGAAQVDAADLGAGVVAVEHRRTGLAREPPVTPADHHHKPWQLIEDPRHLVRTALWPNLISMGIVLQFGPGRHHFQNEEQRITALPQQDAVDALARVFGQPGSTTKIAGSDVWVEISREWQGDWRHRDAARHLKVRPHIHFVIDATDNGTRVTSFSREFQLGMYDVLKLAEEMSESGVALARQATS